MDEEGGHHHCWHVGEQAEDAQHCCGCDATRLPGAFGVRLTDGSTMSVREVIDEGAHVNADGDTLRGEPSYGGWRDAIAAASAAESTRPVDVIYRVLADLDPNGREACLSEVDGMFRAEKAAMATLTRFELSRAYRNKTGRGCLLVQGSFMPYDDDLEALVAQTPEGALVDMRSKNPAEWELIDDQTWLSAWRHPASESIRSGRTISIREWREAADRDHVVEAEIVDDGFDDDDSPSESELMQRRLYSTSDAQVWAREFMNVVRGFSAQSEPPGVDEGFMIGWFANAMTTAERLAAHDHGKQLAHIVDEWGLLGVLRQLLDPLDDIERERVLRACTRTRAAADDEPMATP